MTIYGGECGHIKSHLDNHLKCICSSHCSRESTCSTCSLWSDSIWDQKERRRTYASRKFAMSKKKKRSQALSDSSVEEKNHGNNTPLARLPGGRPIKVATPRVCVPSRVCPPATSHRAPGNQPPGKLLPANHPLDKKMSRTGHRTHRAPVTGHRPPSKWA